VRVNDALIQLIMITDTWLERDILASFERLIVDFGL
jgi:hypothetical protein